MTHRLRRRLCGVLAAVLLGAQMATAAYACPQITAPQIADAQAVAVGEATGAAQTATAVQASATPAPLGAAPIAPVDCDPTLGRTDPDFANLCAEHCKRSDQGDRPAPPTLPVALAASWYPALAPRMAEGPTRSAPPLTRWAAVADPPHAILHCCFRL